MLVTFIKRTHIYSLSLPEKVHGQYWIKDMNEKGEFFDLIAIEGINGQWVLRANKKVRLLKKEDAGKKNIPLQPLAFYDLQIWGEEDSAVLYTEPVTQDRQVYNKFLVNRNCELTIGRLDGSDIRYASRYVSSRHAKLSYRNRVWTIADEKSTNGTFLNNCAVGVEETLKPGDVVYIMGMKLIVGDGFLACNNPDGQIKINSSALVPIKPPMPRVKDEEDEEPLSTEYFYRSPRFKRDVEKAKFRVDSPPNDQVGDEMPMMLTIGPSITMGMASVATGTFTIANAVSSGNIQSAIPSAVMSLSMLLGTMLWPVISKTYDKKRKRKREAKRQEKYTKYLQDMKGKFDAEAERQKEILKENCVMPEECMLRIEEIRRNLWERSAGQNDFLQLRLGMGDLPLDAEINYAERKFTLDEDNLTEEMYRLCERPKLLENVPVSLPLVGNSVSGVIGDRRTVHAFAKSLILQLTALYGYDEVKTVFLYNEKDESEMSFAKWLPHVWDDDKNFRFIASNTGELKEVSSYLQRVIEHRENLNDNDAEEAEPYYVIFAFDKDMALRAEALKQVYSSKKRLNISVIACLEELKNLPKECSTVLELIGDKGKLYDRNDVSGEVTEFRLDALVFRDLMPVAKQLANIPLDLSSGAYALPRMITFLEMFGVGKVEHLNCLARWKENDPTKSLQAAVGVNTLGDAFTLDLHEKVHGPHGLVAGMTGSGKSEFIITYILSLAVNYHPDEVAFILIDYKGGGMAKSFKNLPHTAGIITNLDGGAIKRSLISIESELLRRQAIFNKAGERLEVSNIDIYKYQKLYREGLVDEPLQHLFIISDEFAELKTQKPEFMAQLVSAARIGRSLGVHLILATQKPAGVVDDQIWSNSKFRVCLKVQDRSDSMDMLKRAEAAELVDTGRFYLQVGYNELFELGQSAWAGAPYYPAEKAVKEKEEAVTLIDRNGRVVKKVKLDKRAGQYANPPKQLDAITQYLRDIAAEENIFIRKLWLEPIPACIYLAELRKKYNMPVSNGYILNPLVGEYDDPRNQRQCPMTLPLTEEGNVVIYGSAGCGKTSFLNAMIYSLITEHTPDQVNLYILDFAAETLRAFASAPHVGDVVLSYEKEKISNLFKLLLAEVEKRKKLFADYGGDYQAYLSESGKSLPNIVVVINNFSAFTELYEEKEEAVSYLSREGRKYGLYFALTALGTGVVRYRLLQNFKQLITLQLNDEAEYATVVGKTDGLLPSKFKGRGLIKTDSVYEFQTAFLTKDVVPFKFIQKDSESRRSSWKGTGAKKIPILPEVVTADFVRSSYDLAKPLTIPVGVESSSLNIHNYAFDQSCVSLILSEGDQYVELLQAVSAMAANSSMNITFIDAAKHVKKIMPGDMKYVFTSKDCRIVVEELFELLVSRNNSYKDALEQGQTPPEYDPCLVVIDSFSALKNSLEDQQKQKLELLMEKNEMNYAVYFIVGSGVTGLKEFAYDKWYKKHTSGSDGIWVGNGISDQYQLKIGKISSDMRQEIGNDFGFAVNKGTAIKMKLLSNS